MGNTEISSTISANSFTFEQMQDVSRLYYSKLLFLNKKSINQFKFQVSSIIKRLSYLPFKWAATFEDELRSSNMDQIYALYLSILKKNYMRQGKKQKVFYSCKLGKLFIQHIYSQYRLDSSILNPSKFKQLIHEYKCYAMVINWLNQLSTAKNDQKVNHSTIHPNYVEDKHAYNLLLKSVTKMYSQSLDNHNLQKIYENQPYNSSPIVGQLMKLKTKSSFLQKQKSVDNIQNILINNQTELEQSIEIIKDILGDGEIFAYLIIVRELGNTNLQYLWEKVNGDAFLNNFTD